MLAFLVRARSDNNALVPNSVLPPAVSNLFGPTYAIKNSSSAANARLAFVSPMVPWTTVDGQRVVRSKVACKSSDCTANGYAIQLPVLYDLERPADAWPEYANTWNLDNSILNTGSNQTYPLATVIKVPRDAPASAKFVIDAGLEPLTLNNSKALNITGPYASSFVLQNKSTHEVYFTRTQGLTQGLTYWTISAGSNVLLWPSNIYTTTEKSWQATKLSPFLTDEECAYIAETLMFSRL